MKYGVLCGLTALACAFASAASVKVDCSRTVGAVKPVNGVGQPPTLGWTNYGLFHYLKEAGIPFSRARGRSASRARPAGWPETGGWVGITVGAGVGSVMLI